MCYLSHRRRRQGLGIDVGKDALHAAPPQLLLNDSTNGAEGYGVCAVQALLELQHILCMTAYMMQ